MFDFDTNAPVDMHHPNRFGRAIDRVCWIILLVVIGTVITGLMRRAHFEHSYTPAVFIGVIGALVLFIGLAQQAIAARDLETWRMMAEWQLRAAQERVGLRSDALAAFGEDNDTERAYHYAVLSDILIEEMMAIHDESQESDALREVS